MMKNIRLYAAPLPERLHSGNGDMPIPYHDCRDSRVQGDEAASVYLRPVLPGGAHAADFGILDDEAGTLFEQFSVYTLYSKHEGVPA